MSMIQYLEELLALTTKYRDDIAVGHQPTDDALGRMFGTSYSEVVNVIATSEVMRQTGLPLLASAIVYRQPNCTFTLDPVTLSWSVNKSSGITMDVTKAENDIVSNPEVARALTALASTGSIGEVDMILYIQAKVAFMVALASAAVTLIDELNGEIISTMEEAA